MSVPRSAAASTSRRDAGRVPHRDAGRVLRRGMTLTAATVALGGAGLVTSGTAHADDTGVPVLEAIKTCESIGNYTATNPASTASGAYQFLDSTWRSLRASAGYARAKDAPAAVQDAAAIELYRAQGTTPWASSQSCWGQAGAPEGSAGGSASTGTPSAPGTPGTPSTPGTPGTLGSDDGHATGGVRSGAGRDAARGSQRRVDGGPVQGHGTGARQGNAGRGGH